jgi:CRP-like cAMP-binding protein
VLVKNIEKNLLYETPLFTNVKWEDYVEAIDGIEIIYKSYSHGMIIDDDGPEKKNAIGLIVSGQVNAMKHLISGKESVLKTIKVGDLFGLGNVFGNEIHELSFLEVSTEATVIYIHEKELLKLFTNQQVLKNYLAYINTKIQYLNMKIDIMSQSSIRDKVIMYIENQQIRHGKSSVIKLDMTKTMLAEYLGVSRASLYRVLDELCDENLLELRGQEIYIKQQII